MYRVIIAGRQYTLTAAQLKRVRGNVTHLLGGEV